MFNSQLNGGNAMWLFAALTTFVFNSVVPSMSSYVFGLPDNTTLAKWDYELQTKLQELVASVTNIDVAHKSYAPDSNVKLQEVHGEEILHNVLEKMNELLDRKRKALQRLVDCAENSVTYLDDTFREMLSLEDVPFFNMKAVPPNATLVSSPRLRQKVSFEQSGVHIPLEIFDSYPEILNGLNWSHSLDAVFKSNWEEDQMLRWQYFGSSHGFMRVYPAFRWPDHPSLPDLFDVRRRSWYVQGSVSPKDMIILIDRSGSVHGQTLDIMKITVRALLNSLGEDDYVNVAWFNNRVKWVVPCLNTLVQATAQNRRLLSDAVERLTESNLTSYTAALDFAFEAFKQFDEERKPWSGANCHKAIMFLSDGGTDWPEELVTQHCNQSRTDSIKIFTFACGPHPIPTVVLKKMACNTGGYFSPITALGSVRVKVQDYVRVLTRPLATSVQRGLFNWHNFYRDVGGLGMMTTVTLPVYSKGLNETTDQLLGVMGIDVPVEEMADLFPKHELAAFGYPFAINKNGYVVFHPRLRDHIVYIEDPPDVDLTDLEGSSPEIEEMRRAMVDGKRGKLLNFTSLVPVGLGHAIPVRMNYFFGAVNSSTFRFGVALPTDAVRAEMKLDDFNASITLLENMEGVLVAPWRFCPMSEHREILSAQQLAERIRANVSVCEMRLVWHLLKDLSQSRTIQAAWHQSVAAGVYSRFLMTSGGLTLVHPAKVSEDYLRQRDPFRNNLFKWASRTNNCVLSVARRRSFEITVACRIFIPPSFVAGVVGVEMERSLVQDIFQLVTYNDDLVSCKDPFSLYCYLLNDGGVVVSTNQPEIRAGEFIGETDPQILQILLQSGTLGRDYRFNYQSWCSKEVYQVQTMGAAQRVSILNTVYQAIQTLLSFNIGCVYDYFIYLLTSLTLWGTVQAGEMPSPVANHSCVTRSSWFYTMDAKSRREKFWCMGEEGPCERELHISILPKLSLIFVVTTPTCSCNDPIPSEHIDPQDVGPDHCDIRQPYRIRPDQCFVEKSRPTNETDCGASSTASAAEFKHFFIQNFLFLSIILLLERE